MLALPGVEEVLDRDAAVAELELPADRIGDLYVLAASDAVLGRTPSDHDLSQLHGTLRSHGGKHETTVPFLVSEPVASPLRGYRNFDIFQLTCNFGADA